MHFFDIFRAFKSEPYLLFMIMKNYKHYIRKIYFLNRCIYSVNKQ